MISRSHLNILVVAVGALCFFCSDTSLIAQRYFPLDVGAKWTYKNDTFASERVHSVTGIDENGTVSFSRQVVGGGEFIIRLREDGNVISIEIPDEDFFDYYRLVWT